MARRKNPAAVALGSLGGKARAKSLSAEQRSAIGAEAGKARAAKLTAERRREIAKAAAEKRWKQTACPSCGALLGARERRKHKCGK